MALRIRRGLEADRTSITPDEGEFLYVTDTGLLYIGDGTTAGGNLVAGGGGGIESATASGTDTYTATISGVASYATHDIYEIIFTNANTGSSTININSLGAKTLKKAVSTNLAASDIAAGQSFIIVYDGTNFQVIGIGGSGGGTPGGSDTYVQYNDAGAFGGEAAFTYDKTTNTLDVDIATVNDDAYDATTWNGSVQVPTKNAVRDKIESILTSVNTSFDFQFDGMGAVILVNSIVYFRVANACTISGWSIVAEGTSPTCTLDILKIASGTTLPTASIVASAAPALSTGNAVKSTTLTGWTTSVAADDIIAVKVTACAAATKINFTIYR